MENKLAEFGTFFKQKRILVSGATGFVGYHLCKDLLDLDAKVFGTAIDNNLHEDIRQTRLTNLDFRQAERLDQYIQDIQPQVVFHLASLVNTSRQIELVYPTLEHNLLSTVNLMLSLVKHPVDKVIIVSSSEAPTGSETPNSPYAASKEAVTSYARMFAALYGLPVSIAKLFTCFGPLQRRDKLIPYLINSAASGQPPVLTNPKKILDFIYVKDFTRGLLCTAMHGSTHGDILDFGSGRGMMIESMAHLIRYVYHNTTSIGYRPDFTSAENTSTPANIEETYKAIGWQPAWDLQEALKETILWYQNQSTK